MTLLFSVATPPVSLYLSKPLQLCHSMLLKACMAFFFQHQIQVLPHPDPSSPSFHHQAPADLSLSCSLYLCGCVTLVCTFTRCQAPEGRTLLQCLSLWCCCNIECVDAQRVDGLLTGMASLHLVLDNQSLEFTGLRIRCKIENEVS